MGHSQAGNLLKLYRAATACSVSGLKPVTLRQWHLRDIIQPEADALPSLFPTPTETRMLRLRPTPEFEAAVKAVQNAQRHGWRLYLFTDLLRIVVVTRLISAGVELKRAATIARAARIAGGPPDPHRIYITSDGKELPSPPEPDVKGGKQDQEALRRSDRFLVAFAPADDHPPSDNPEDHEWRTWRIQNCYGADHLARVLTAVHDPIYERFLDPKAFVVLNLSAIRRELEAKLIALGEGVPEEDFEAKG